MVTDETMDFSWIFVLLWIGKVTIQFTRKLLGFSSICVVIRVIRNPFNLDPEMLGWDKLFPSCLLGFRTF